MHGEETSHLPPDYRLDLVGDPCVIILLRPDGTVLAHFSLAAEPEEIRRVAQVDYQGTRQGLG
jgi:hypothetical protein